MVGRTSQRVERIDSRSYVGSGKLAELVEEARALGADTILFDDELRPSQGRNVEEAAGEGIRVCDRTALILDIFRQNAATREGFLQVQLARISYQMPRQTRLWQHLDRQSGGGGGGATKGMGESQLEIDKRLLKEQASRLRERLESVRTHRAVHRTRRASAPIPVLALVGYTSAGKSTLLNTLTDEKTHVLTDSALFSTLDPTTRRATRPNGAPTLLTDTVGFCSKLPTALVAAFRATLEEIAEASLIVHVVDASRPNSASLMAVVDDVLKGMDGVESIPRLLVFNKVDRLEPEARRQLQQKAAQSKTPAVCMSAATGEGVDSFWAAVQSFETLVAVDALIPHAHLELLSQIRRLGEVEAEEWLPEGVHIAARVPLAVSRRLAEWRTGASADADLACENVIAV